MNIPQTQNEDYGFFGTVALHHDEPQELWNAAVLGIAAATGESLEDAALFLDTRHGRHFADDVVGGLLNGLDGRAAVAAAVDRWLDWSFGKELARETGLPAGTPYLHGLVVVVAACH
ncbi:hypothetical protein [Neisseria animalis]|uniref:Uncharacterized protein n=1 Tax=Neisseria animalis TaxID=492 RepID=A0A5P3MPT3_NEIAN|nr:hypothetical protein [Neisseria animalis]QEY23563.1 hypothetical protein D0T90_02825 [Neisseria animalis]ROW32163.1 hypothetical protein CGZ60_06205 [Neisseria animalis]VEE09229.1 Uncharacterised protein [Neisseria animalis]